MNEYRDTESSFKANIEAEASKFGPFLESEHISRTVNLPRDYNRDRIVLMARDPWCIFSYWEITPQKEQGVKEKMAAAGECFQKSILRVYDVTGIVNFTGVNVQSYFDITLSGMARNWYIAVGPAKHSWCVEIGLLSEGGNFYALARSNIVHIPPAGMSDIWDEKWMLTEEEYYYIAGASEGFDVGKSSLEMKELLQRRLREWVSSGGIGGPASESLLKERNPGKD